MDHPDELPVNDDVHKPEGFDFHRRFLSPGGTAVITTPRDQWRGRAFYTIMADRMNFGYRELMTVRQLGLYALENGFRIDRAGVIKAHNGPVCRVRRGLAPILGRDPQSLGEIGIEDDVFHVLPRACARVEDHPGVRVHGDDEYPGRCRSAVGGCHRTVVGRQGLCAGGRVQDDPHAARIWRRQTMEPSSTRIAGDQPPHVMKVVSRFAGVRPTPLGGRAKRHRQQRHEGNAEWAREAMESHRVIFWLLLVRAQPVRESRRPGVRRAFGSQVAGSQRVGESRCPGAPDVHPRFREPRCAAGVATPRHQWRGREFFTIMADRMNFGYRELMTVRQLGLHAWVDGFRIGRAGVVRAHKGLVCRVR